MNVFRKRNAIRRCSGYRYFHLLVITSSNYLVQLPVSIFGFIPLGAFSSSIFFLSLLT